MFIPYKHKCSYASSYVNIDEFLYSYIPFLLITLVVLCQLVHTYVIRLLLLVSTLNNCIENSLEKIRIQKNNLAVLFLEIPVFMSVMTDRQQS